MSQIESWTPVCQADDLVSNSGVCALIDDQQVAIFKVKLKSEEQVFAIDNWDPIGKSYVLYRGLVGSVDEDIVVASPLYKQRFSLVTGKCYDAEIENLRVYPVKIEGDSVQVATQHHAS